MGAIRHSYGWREGDRDKGLEKMKKNRSIYSEPWRDFHIGLGEKKKLCLKRLEVVKSKWLLWRKAFLLSECAVC